MYAESAERTPLPRILLRPIGAPLTLGLSGLGIASVVESGLGLGWFPAAETRETGLILVAVPFVLQLLACVLSYLARDGAAGAAVGVLSGTWLAVGLVHLYTGSPGRDGAAGVLLLSASMALCASAGTVARCNPLAGGAFFLAAARFALEGVYQSGGGGAWKDASGIMGLVLAGVVFYALIAFELEGQARRQLLPTFRRERGGPGPHGGVLVDDLVREPGVRQTT